MFKTIPVLKDYIWGGEKLKELYGRKSDDKIAESWEISVHKDGESLFYNTDETLAGYIKNNKGCLGNIDNLPVLIKYIDAKKNLSLQVHPEDEYARIHENDNGKTEMWYIIAADDYAGIYCGLKNDITKEQFKKHIYENTVESVLNFIPVKAGDCFLIEAGTLHAICKGVMICEIQQSSNVTYRVYDYGRKGADGKPRELHIEKALQVANLKKFRDKTNSGEYISFGNNKKRLLTKCKYFECFEFILSEDYSYVNDKSYTAINVIKGEGMINDISFKSGDSFFVPLGEKMNFKGNGTLILTQLCD